MVRTSLNTFQALHRQCIHIQHQHLSEKRRVKQAERVKRVKYLIIFSFQIFFIFSCGSWNWNIGSLVRPSFRNLSDIPKQEITLVAFFTSFCCSCNCCYYCSCFLFFCASFSLCKRYCSKKKREKSDSIDSLMI